MLVNGILLLCRARANDNHILPNPLESALKEWTPRVGKNPVRSLDYVPNKYNVNSKLHVYYSRLVLDVYRCFSIGSDS